MLHTENRQPEKSGVKDTRGSMPRVLVVDDEPLMGATLEVTLGDEYTVEVVSSVQAAEQRLQSDGGFDLILCDLMMPGRSGMDLYRWVAQAKPELASRMIFMSGGAYTSEAHEFLERVGRHRIDKPFDIDALLDLMREIRKTAA
ncbi:MAG: response regulator [Polyangiaceae bacterium]|nr:response regulator [Polyangiaceae bacterium]